MANVKIIEFARKNKMNPNDLFYMTRREKLISEEIYLWEFEDVGKPGSIFMMMRNSKKM